MPKAEADRRTGEGQLITPALTERLRRRIAEHGPISFCEFMEAALYDPDEGFYTRTPVGVPGEFVTSPHVSPLFGILAARQVEDFWDLLGRPRPLDVVEIGAGDGALAIQVLEALPPALVDSVRYTAVERGPAGRAAIESRGVRAVASLADVHAIGPGCVIANELLDNLPFHRIRRTEHGLVELFVALDGERFTLVEGPPSSEELARLAPPMRPGQDAAVSPSSVALLGHAAASIGRGYIWLLDYGPGPGEEPTPVHGYRAHRVESDVLSDPGSRDITAGVDFPLLARQARWNGWAVWGPISQRRALLALGFRELDRRAQARQVEAVAARRGIEALRIYSNRTRANLLLGRGGLGSFHVLCIGVDVAPDVAPRSFRTLTETCPEGP